ncbi:MAG: short-chain dehydrogenase [Phenylobacterium sp.]|nr:short-chain dehydrogenase [Phenylobacterium sp.]
MAQHPALIPGRVAVITGAASGIGLATARKLADLGMTVVLADRPGEALDAAAAGIGGKARAVATDVRDAEALSRLKDAADALGEVSFLMNNAGVGGGGKPWENPEGWRRVLETNLFGVVNGLQAFVPEMLARGGPGAIVNTGSKQGITTPPGDAAYNASKAAIKVVTEQLAHELRNAAGGAQITAHLLIPGFTFTGLTAGTRTDKPPGAWSAEQVADRLLYGLSAGEFYVWCEDNETPRGVDERRIQWAADDIIQNRPALSRWHPDHAEAFKAYMAAETK